MLTPNKHQEDVLILPRRRCFLSLLYHSPFVLQTVIMYASMMFVIIKGAVDVGGFSYVWEKASESGRATLVDFDPNPATRHTFWTLIVGGYFTWITIYGVNQAQVLLHTITTTIPTTTIATFITTTVLLLYFSFCPRPVTIITSPSPPPTLPGPLLLPPPTLMAFELTFME